MSELLDIIKTRRSIRKFKPDAVPQELIEKVVEAGTYAASGRGKQSPVIIVIENEDLKEELSKLNSEIFGKPDFDTFYKAPVYILVAADASANTCVYDGTLALGNMMLEAHALGLGTCWIHRAKESMEHELYKDLFRSLGIEGEYVGVGHLALGYADCELPKAAPRKENYVYYVK